MTENRLIWPATLHHFALTSEDPKRLVDWYGSALGLEQSETFGDGFVMRGVERNLLIMPGPSGGVAFAAYACADDDQLNRLAAHLKNTGLEVTQFDTPLFPNRALSITDLDGNIFVFGLPEKPEGQHDPLPGRLQHIVFTTQQLPEQIDFYTGALGFRKSDVVVNDAKIPTACFMRSDPEHHSLGLFRSSVSKLDHFCFESTCWNDIRDWGDHFADLRIPIVWGAGRHGAGNNLFIFVEDPDGNKPEISAEIERMTYEQEAREWLHEQRTLNLWGSAWMRS